jgi:hypothetical protein
VDRHAVDKRDGSFPIIGNGMDGNGLESQTKCDGSYPTSRSIFGQNIVPHYPNTPLIAIDFNHNRI